MKSRPSHLSAVTALSRLGAVAVLLSPATPDELLAPALALGGAETVIVDPDSAARARAAIPGKVLVLGGVGEVPWQPGQSRVLPPDVIDMEAIAPETVPLPAWYRPDAGRASELAMVFVTATGAEPPRAVRITNRRWAFAALGAAAAATLTTRDTVYCCLPLHHPSGTLVATGSALVSGARLALASRFAPDTLWDEVRRYGVSVVYYAGEMCRRLVDAPAVLGENNNPVRLFAGSGLRKDVWRRLVDRFGPVGVLEMYASSEASIVLANARGKKLGSVGRPLPGSPEVAVAAWSFADADFVRDPAGHLVHARLDEPGLLVARLTGTADIAASGARRVLRDAFAPGDRWLVTGDVFQVDAEGDYWLVDRADQMIVTAAGPVASLRIEDAIYDAPGIALAAVAGRPDPDAPTHQAPFAAIALHPGKPLDGDALSRAVAALPDHGRPRRIRVVESLPLTDGFRPIKRAIAQLDFADGPDVLAWDPATQRYRPTSSVA
jgi:putative long chain acyl-CoA synthase